MRLRSILMKPFEITSCTGLLYPPEKVYQVLADSSAFSAWWPESLQCRVSGGPESEIIQFQMGMLDFIGRIKLASPSEEIVWEFTEGNVLGVGRWLFQPGDMGTQLQFMVTADIVGPFARMYASLCQYPVRFRFRWRKVIEALNNETERRILFGEL